MSQKWAELQDNIKVSILVYGFALVCIQVYVFALVQLGGFNCIINCNFSVFQLYGTVENWKIILTLF